MTEFTSFVGKVQANIIDPIITVVALAAFILFVYGVVEYLRGGADEAKRKQGQQHMLWGIIGLAILFGARTIVTILGNIVAGVS